MALYHYGRIYVLTVIITMSKPYLNCLSCLPVAIGKGIKLGFVLIPRLINVF